MEFFKQEMELFLYIRPNLSIQIVLAKLRQQTVLDHHRRHLKAAKVKN
jgi:hypothetical protein